MRPFWPDNGHFFIISFRKIEDVVEIAVAQITDSRAGDDEPPLTACPAQDTVPAMPQSWSSFCRLMPKIGSVMFQCHANNRCHHELPHVLLPWWGHDIYGQIYGGRVFPAGLTWLDIGTHGQEFFPVCRCNPQGTNQPHNVMRLCSIRRHTRVR